MTLEKSVVQLHCFSYKWRCLELQDSCNPTYQQYVWSAILDSGQMPMRKDLIRIGQWLYETVSKFALLA